MGPSAVRSMDIAAAPAGAAERGSRWVFITPGILRFQYVVQLTGFGSGDRLHTTRGPADLDPLDPRIRTEAEVQGPLVLRAEAASATHFLHLDLSVPVHRYPRADGARVALPAGQIESDPVVPRRSKIPVDEKRAALMRH